MFKFLRKKREDRYRAITLHAIDRPSVSINRPKLVTTLLSICESQFGSLPTDYDIMGPYGIRKGQSVGIRAFQNKLSKFGHERYDAYFAYKPDTENELCPEFGFNADFSCSVSDQHAVSDVVIHWARDRFDVDELSAVIKIQQVFPIDYGYVWNYPENYDPVYGSWRRKTWLSYSSRPDDDARSWRTRIPTVLEGAVRGVYPINLLNKAQLSSMLSDELSEPTEIADGLYVVRQKTLLDDEKSRGQADKTS